MHICVTCVNISTFASLDACRSTIAIITLTLFDTIIVYSVFLLFDASLLESNH